MDGKVYVGKMLTKRENMATENKSRSENAMELSETTQYSDDGILFFSDFIISYTTITLYYTPIHLIYIKSIISSKVGLTKNAYVGVYLGVGLKTDPTYLPNLTPLIV